MTRAFTYRLYPNSFLENHGNPDMVMGGSAIAAPGSTGSLTIEGWFYFPPGSTGGAITGTTSGGIMCVEPAAGGGGNGFTLFGDGSYNLIVGVGVGAITIVIGYFTNRSGWYHLVLTLDHTTGFATLYENGVQIGQVTPGAWNLTSTLVFEAGTEHNAIFGVQGLRAAACRTYSRALSLSEAQDRYYDARSDSSINANLEGEWLFSEGSGTTAADTSGHSRTMTLASSSDWSHNGPIFPNRLHHVFAGSVTTTDASTTNVTALSFALPNGSTCAFKIRYQLRVSDGSSALLVQEGLGKNVSSTVSQVGTIHFYPGIKSDTSPTDLSTVGGAAMFFDTGTQSAYPQIAGIAAKTIVWKFWIDWFEL